jgi:hypothetical protein
LIHKAYARAEGTGCDQRGNTNELGHCPPRATEAERPKPESGSDRTRSQRSQHRGIVRRPSVRCFGPGTVALVDSEALATEYKTISGPELGPSYPIAVEKSPIC